jgi:hypothetical protein
MPIQFRVVFNFVGVALAFLCALSAAAGHSAPSATGSALQAPHSMEAFMEQIGAAKRAESPAQSPVSLASTRQDWKHLTPDVSCHTLTPLQIGQKRYAKGLGAPANGTATFQLRAPFATFLAAPALPGILAGAVREETIAPGLVELLVYL